jgi:hypothetical protein
VFQPAEKWKEHKKQRKKNNEARKNERMEGRKETDGILWQQT